MRIGWFLALIVSALVVPSSSQGFLYEPSVEIELVGPDEIIDLKAGESRTVDVEVRLDATNYACLGSDTAFPLTVTLAYAEVPRGFSVEAPLGFSLGTSTSIILFMPSRNLETLNLTFSYAGTDGDGLVIPVAIAVWFDGGQMDGCTTAADFPKADDMTLIHVRLPDAPDEESTTDDADRESPAASIGLVLLALALLLGSRRS